jgi:hypothetical protein
MKKIIFIFSLILATSSAQADFQSKIETLLSSFKGKVGTAGDYSCKVYTEQGPVSFKALTLIFRLNGSMPLEFQSQLESWFNLNTKESTTTNGATLFTRETTSEYSDESLGYNREEIEILKDKYIRYELFDNDESDSPRHLTSVRAIVCKF